jgi:integrase/recombinase XerD
VTRLRKLMVEELERRNYAPGTTRAYLRAVDDFARYFNRPPDQLGPDHIRQYQAYLFRERKVQTNTVIQHLG